ncbi:galactose-binding domain-like protein [Russula aff. rugulosa BPL654]|nr:galactose-binding domain-like protein [Russula aff. rugulosa BPL654]
MSHNHDHGDHAHDHDHDHAHPNTGGPSDNVFIHIDRDNVIALNSIGEAKQVINPWDERVYIESDADDQLIIRVPFTGSVKPRSLLLKSGPGEQTPAKSSSHKESLQQFDVAVGREVGEVHAKVSNCTPAKFPNVSTITLFFPASQGAETTRIYYIGFLGQWSERKQDPVITIQGTDGNLNMPSH